MKKLTLTKRPVVGRHRGTYRTTGNQNIEALEHLRYKLGGIPTLGTGKHRATR